MKRSKSGQFYGETNERISLKGITLTDTEYTQAKVDWHFHENNYFTFILEGGMLEGNKQATYECSAGDLLYHNWEDAHYNIKSNQFTRGFHVELEPQWFESLDIDAELTQGSIHIGDPKVKTLMYNLFKEVKLSGDGAQLAVDALLAAIFGVLGKIRRSSDNKKPKWVDALKEMLRGVAAGDQEDRSLVELAKILQVHPVHLSREFPKHFNMTLGDYLRTLKIQRALSLLPNRALSLTDIAFTCDFTDQSHFIRSFKAYHHITPAAYRKLLLR